MSDKPTSLVSALYDTDSDDSAEDDGGGGRRQFLGVRNEDDRGSGGEGHRDEAPLQGPPREEEGGLQLGSGGFSWWPRSDSDERIMEEEDLVEKARRVRIDDAGDVNRLDSNGGGSGAAGEREYADGGHRSIPESSFIANWSERRTATAREQWRQTMPRGEATIEWGEPITYNPDGEENDSSGGEAKRGGDECYVAHISPPEYTGGIIRQFPVLESNTSRISEAAKGQRGEEEDHAGDAGDERPTVGVVQSEIIGEDPPNDLIFRCTLTRRIEGGLERPILQTEMIRPDGDEERARRRHAHGPGGWWLAMTIVASLVLITTATEAEPLVTVRESNGEFVHAHEGKMYPGAGTGTLRISLGGGQMVDTLTEFHDTAVRVGGKARYIAIATEHKKEEMINAMEFFTVSEAEKEEREKKDLGGVLSVFNSFFGLFNSARLSDVNFRLDKQEEAAKLETKEVQGLNVVLGQMMTAINKSEEIVASEVENISKRVINEAMQRVIEEEFLLVNTNCSALTRVLRTATSHRADPALADLVNMTQVWVEMKEELRDKDMGLPGDHWQHLLQLPIDIWVVDREITIDIHFPTRPLNTKAMVLHTWVPSPLFVNRQLLHVRSEGRNFGTDKSGMVAVITGTSDCVNYGEVKFCRGPIIMERPGFYSTCLTAIWRMNIPQIKALCELTVTPIRDAILPTGSRMYQVSVETEMMLLVECKDGRSQSKTLQGGMYSVKVRPGCYIQNDLFRTEEGAAIGVQTTVVKPVESHLDLLTPDGVDNSTATKITERLRKVKQPTKPADMSSRILDDLEARGSSVTKFYVIIALLVLGLVAAAGAVIFILWRGGKLATLVRTNQEECRRHQQPQQQQQEHETVQLEDRRVSRVSRDSLDARAMLAQLDETLRLAERRMQAMAPEEREDMIGRLEGTSARVRGFNRPQPRVQPEGAAEKIEVQAQIAPVPQAQMAFLAPDQGVAVMPEIVNGQ